MEYIICHYGELALKGKNRSLFERRLVKNIERSLPKGSFEFVKRISGRFIIKISKKGLKQQRKIKEALEKVFGISYFAFGYSCEQTLSDMKKTALEALKKKNFKTFRISAKRAGKDFYLTSQQINEKVGEFIIEKLKKKVKLKNPGATCFIEVVEKYAFLYTSKIRGLGGLPVGVSGRSIVLLSGGIDSPVAAFRAMKRGVRTIFVHFHAHPYTDKASIEKVKRIASVLNKFQFDSKLYLIPFADIQKEILLNSTAKLRIVLYRRFMLRIAEEIAKKEGALALVTGDSIGQVASQTLENLRTVSLATKIFIFRPLVCRDKEEIIKEARNIDTYNLSILPHQDCCVRFLPLHPETKSNPKEVKIAEKNLNIKKLVKKAVKDASIVEIGDES